VSIKKDHLFAFPVMLKKKHNFSEARSRFICRRNGRRTQTEADLFGVERRVLFVGTN